MGQVLFLFRIFVVLVHNVSGSGHRDEKQPLSLHSEVSPQQVNNLLEAYVGNIYLTPACCRGVAPFS